MNVSMSLRVTNRADAVAKRFPGALDAVMSAGAERTAAYARAHHPWQNRTGGTEQSVHVEHAGDHQFTVVADNASIFLEYGTIHMPPYPFLRPAIRATQDSYAASFEKLASHLE